MMNRCSRRSAAPSRLAALARHRRVLAQQPLTPRSVVAALDGQKLTYEVPNFRIGGKYDLAQPAAWANGGVGGTTLESLGAKPARTAYIAMGTPQAQRQGRDRQRHRHQLVLLGRCDGDVQQLGRGASRQQLLGRRAGRPRAAVRHQSLLRRLRRRARAVRRIQALRRARPQVPGLQLLRRRAPELPAAARPPEGRQGGAAPPACRWGRRRRTTGA